MTNAADLLATPADVARLNDLILQLAVQGKLVPQDPADEPASELLKRIRATKAQLVKDKLIAKPKPLPPIQGSPFELPAGWVWVCLDEIVQKIGSGSTPKGGKQVYEAEGIKFIRSQNVWNDGLKLGSVAFITEKTHEKMAESAVKARDILLNITGASIARSAVVPEDFDTGNVSQHVSVIRLVEPAIRHFIHACLISPYVYNLIMSVQVGISREGLSMARLREFVLPLPPLAEQHRIVARVESLLAQTRRLAELLAQAQSDLARLNESALAHLRAAQAPAESSERWQFIATHFDELFQTPAHIAPLRQAVLDLAVRGKLVPQDPNDEPASELLKRIAAERHHILAKEAERASVPEKGQPFPRPRGWEWARLDYITEIGTGIAKGKKLNSAKIVSLPYLRVANVQRGRLDLSVMKELEIKESEIERYILKDGDLLLTEGGDADKLGRSAIWRGEIANCIHQNHIFRARPYSELKTEWLMLYTNSSYGREYFLASSKQTTNLASINKTQLSNCPIPIPPLAEQHRIVARVEQLLALCDNLQVRLQAAEAERQRLLAAVIAGVSIG